MVKTWMGIVVWVGLLLLLNAYGDSTHAKKKNAEAMLTPPSNPVSATVPLPTTGELVKPRKIPPPDLVKAIYVTSWTAGTKNLMSDVIKIVTGTEVNTLVIDIKDYSGYVGYETGLEKVKKYNAEQKRIRDINGLLQQLHDLHIYVIGRIAVFQDPQLCRARPALAVKNAKGKVWQDRKGLSWVDPAGREVWDYILEIAHDAVRRGFDEINFDYIRFPSDGEGLSRLVYPVWDGKDRAVVIRRFFHYVREHLPNIPISADLFGLSVVNQGDLGIGQLIEDAYDYFDYVSPMVYPSHFASGFLKYKNPARYPYEVVRYSMESAIKKLSLHEFAAKQNEKTDDKVTSKEKDKEKDKEKEKIAEAPKETGTAKTNPAEKKKKSVAKANPHSKIEANPEKKLPPEVMLKIRKKLRPWLQDFDLGADYTVEMVRKEKKAVLDAGLLDTWMMWNPSNHYRREVFNKIVVQEKERLKTGSSTASPLSAQTTPSQGQ